MSSGLFNWQREAVPNVESFVWKGSFTKVRADVRPVKKKTPDDFEPNQTKLDC